VSIAINPFTPDATADPGRFTIVRPDKKAPPAPPPRVEDKPAANKPAEVDLGVAPGNLPLARAAAANPRVEADRQLEAGRAHFAQGEFSVALDDFRRAIARQPDDAVAWFLLAQAQFAIGKFDDAVVSINAGMKRNPDWPQSRFQSRVIYGNNQVAFDVQNLRNSLATDPNDPCLLFLLGVELWFDGKRDEAIPLFAKAVHLAKDPAPAQAFLQK
jgi:cytochrome c-type biogenesis protein CcmH/NrfG